MNIIQATTLLGLGILIESKEKRKKVLNLFNNLGKTAEIALKQINKGDAKNEPIQETEQQ